MDLWYLFNILWKKRWILLLAGALTATSTWIFSGSQDEAFKAKAVISTGIIEYRGLTLQKESSYVQQFQIESSFNNLIERMRSRSSLNHVTQRLLERDVGLSGLPSTPFRQPVIEDQRIHQNDVDSFVIKLKTNISDSLVVTSPNRPPPSQRLAEAYGYDYQSLSEDLRVQRVGESDMVSVEFEAESAELAFFVVTTFLKEFLDYYETDLFYEENIAVKFHEEQLLKRKAELDSMVRLINDYKVANDLMDVDAQRSSLISHLKELETELEDQRKNATALASQIGILNRKIREYTRYSGDEYADKLFLSDYFVQIDNQIKALQEQIIERKAGGNHNTADLEERIDQLRKQQAQYIAQGAPLPNELRQRVNDQVRSWIMDVVNKRLDLELANAAIVAYQGVILRQKAKFDKLLQDNNHLAGLEEEKKRIEAEYLRVRSEYDAARLSLEGLKNPLALVEPVEFPYEPEPSKRALFTLFAGVGGTTLAAVLLFVLAFLDNTLQNAHRYKQLVGIPLLGQVPLVHTPVLDLHHLFSKEMKSKELEVLKESIRKLRSVVEGGEAQVWLFTSLKPVAGKTFLLLLLAYSLSLRNKKVLVMDTNFRHNTLSTFKDQPQLFLYTKGKRRVWRQFLSGGEKQLVGWKDPNLNWVEFIGNKGGDKSPCEVFAHRGLTNLLERYKESYDFILLEGAGVRDYADALELAPAVQKVVAVFSVGQAIGPADAESLNWMKSLGAKLQGGVLNEVE